VVARESSFIERRSIVGLRKPEDQMLMRAIACSTPWSRPDVGTDLFVKADTAFR